MADDHHDSGMATGLMVVVVIILVFGLWMAMTGRLDLNGDDNDTTIKVELPEVLTPEENTTQ